MATRAIRASRPRGRHHAPHDVETKEQTLPEGSTSMGLPRRVRSADPGGSAAAPPSPCVRVSTSPRKSVPAFASAMTAARDFRASDYAPFVGPNNSFSTAVCEIAPQLPGAGRKVVPCAEAARRLKLLHIKPPAPIPSLVRGPRLPRYAAIWATARNPKPREVSSRHVNSNCRRRV